MTVRVHPQDIEYVDVRPSSDRHEPTNFYEQWLDQSSARHATPELVAADALRRMYPGHSVVVSDDHRLSNLLTLPGVTVHASEAQESGLERVSNVVFEPTAARTGGKVAGTLVDQTIVGSHKLTWNNYEFVVHITKFMNSFQQKSIHFILHDGPEQPTRDFMLAAFLHSEQANDEIWVFNRGGWSKDKTLWLGIKDSSWDDIVMKEESKKALRKDVYGFFGSEMTYKKLSIPWKRGLIMYGPPGNGKTGSIKIIMKTCVERGFVPLYVKSFQCPCGEEVAMQKVFLKTRQLAPCVLIMEDLDSLINDRNRSFFLNELDGLECNNGLLVIASTNHFDKLDPGLSNRPSRFDRKYLFDDPDYEGRVLYAKYWQGKLKENHQLSFSESVVQEVAKLTQGFSFAYLKEAFVSTLVQLSRGDGDERAELSVTLKNQITILRKELGDKTPAHVVLPPLVTQPQREQDDMKRPSITSHSGAQSSQRSRVQGPSLSADIIRVDISDDSGQSPTTHPVRMSPTNAARPLWRAIGQVPGSSSMVHPGAHSAQGYVLPAPASAYPQVMPGSLPSARLGQPQDPNAATRRTVPTSGTSDLKQS